MGNRGWATRLIVGLATAVTTGTTLVVASTKPAAACSCLGAEVSWFVDEFDVGFIGTFRGDRDNPDRSGNGWDDRIATFTVTEWFDGDPAAHLDGDTVEVAAPADGGSCGFELGVGQQAAIFANEGGRWLAGSLCSTLDAGVVRAYLAPQELSGGEAVLAVPGRFDHGGLALLDTEGRLIGYDHRFAFTWVPQLVTCPTGQTALLFDQGRALVVDLTDLSLRREVALGDLLDEGSLASVDCRDPVGDRVDVVVERWHGDRSVHDLRSLDTIDEVGRELDLPTSARPILAGDHLVAQTYLDPGERLIVIDPDGTERTVGELLRTTEDDHRGYVEVAAAPAGADDLTRPVAVLEGEYGENGVTSRLWLLDPATGQELMSRTIEAETWQVSWLDRERLLLLLGGERSSRAEILAADTLETVATVEGWSDGGAVLLGDALWASSGGPVVTGALGGERRELAALPTTRAGPLIALPVPILVEPVGTAAPPFTVLTPTPTEISTSTSTTTIDLPDGTGEHDSDQSGDDEAADPAPPDAAPGGGGLPLLPGAVAVTGLAAAGMLMLRRRGQRGPSSPADSDSMP